MIYNYHYPKPSDIVPQQEEYIKDYIHNFESVMSSNNYADERGGSIYMFNASATLMQSSFLKKHVIRKKNLPFVKKIC